MVWYFGDKAGLDFKSGEPKVLVDGALKAEAGCASICDENGDILFYTNGKKVWNRNHQMMANGNNLNGSQLLNQNSVIVPKPLSDSIYYLFTINQYDSLPGFNYSIIDISKDGGLGELTEKNVPVTQNVLEKITAIEHCNGQDYWIITHGYNNSFYSYLLTDEDFPIDNVKSDVGTQPKADIGYMKVSPAGDKIVLPVNNEDLLAEIYTFNNRTGIVNNPIKIYTKYENTYCYGVEFSPDGNLLYISTRGMNYGIWQYNLRLTNENEINNNAINIADGNNFALQLAPNGRIYIASENRPYLNAIHNPNILGEDCEYEEQAVKFSQGTSLMGLPNFMQSWNYQPSFDVNNTCYLDSTLFTFNQYTNVDSLIWTFNDMRKSQTTSVNDFSVIRVFEDIGLYNVELNIYHCGIEETISKMVEIFPYPESSLVTDTTVCNNCMIVLDAGADFDSYLWNDGSNQQYLNVYGKGTYSVKISKDGCYSKDSVIISEVQPTIELPNAFTPNGDGLNDEFKVVNPYNIVDFNLWIQSRRGEIVFQSNDIFLGWDGSYMGNICNRETFIWHISYSYYNELGILVDEVKIGTVSILR